jgi:hypothetical protein
MENPAINSWIFVALSDAALACVWLAAKETQRTQIILQRPCMPAGYQTNRCHPKLTAQHVSTGARGVGERQKSLGRLVGNRSVHDGNQLQCPARLFGEIDGQIRPNVTPQTAPRNGRHTGQPLQLFLGASADVGVGKRGQYREHLGHGAVAVLLTDAIDHLVHSFHETGGELGSPARQLRV